MQCKDLEAVLEQEELSPLPLEAREHLAACASCQDLLADISAVVVAAKRIPAEVPPPARIWISLRAQLEAEGLIRDVEPLVSPAAEPWWQGFGWQGFAKLLRPRALATVGAGLFFVLCSMYVVERRGRTDLAKNPPPTKTQVSATPNVPTPPPAPAKPAVPLRNSPNPIEVAGVGPRLEVHPPSGVLKPSPSEIVSFAGSAALLSETENALPSRELADNAAVDASLRQNLRTLNEFIAECEARLKQNPRDQLTREYLNMAYQQKAELLTAMMDTGRSEN